ncbi:hypothetical protein C8J57DRAFT_1517808 [Mycena rebaudengoi]|nr:hypothetical protein C8J57DRAFT_1517808 [Mycena rebaudengoi]
MAPKALRPSTGPSQALIERINYLKQLLSHLPETIPLNPESSLYRFYLNEDHVARDGSVFAETCRALDVSFKTQMADTPLKITERGTRLEALLPFLRNTIKRMTSAERVTFEGLWIDKLIKGAKASGATIPPRGSKRKEPHHAVDNSDSDEVPAPKRGRKGAMTIISDDDMGDEQSSSIHPPRIHPPFPCVPKQTLAPGVQVSSTSDVDLVQNQQATLAGMGWQSWAPGAKEARQMQMNKEHREGMAAAKRREEEKEEERKERKRQQAAERQRRHRERKKADREDELSEDDNANAVLLRGADALAHQRQIDVPGTSRAGTQGWRAQRNGRNGGAVQKKAQTVNWYNPFLFGHIETAMRRTGWSPTAAVNSLQRDFPNLFKSLAKGTISKWRVKGKNEWKKETMDKVVSGRIITASGRTGILTPYPEITRNVKEILQGLRVAGAVVNVSIARGLLVAEIKEQQPHLLEKFKVSEFYVRTFLASVMDWSPRKVTRQARHIPEDAPVLLERTFFRIRYAILTGGIPPELIVNADQAGNYLLPASGQTFHD